MSIYEYDEEKHMRQEREASLEEGIRKGMELGLEQGLEQGIIQGKEQGEGRMLRLIKCLAEDGQVDAIAHLSEMGENKIQLEKLYQKYNL